eukprot:Em0015g91a
MRPRSAAPALSTRLRPVSARVGADSSRGRSDVSKIRPKSAAVGTRHSSVQEFEERADAGARPLLKDPSSPVYLTRVPEYFNFWAGKPLLSKEFGVTVQTRKKWTRPKSDYGTRFFSKRNASCALDTVVEKDGAENDNLSDGSREEHGIRAASENILDQSDSGIDAERLRVTIGALDGHGGGFEICGTKKSVNDHQSDGQGRAHHDQYNSTHSVSHKNDPQDTMSGRRGHMGSSKHFQSKTSSHTQADNDKTWSVEEQAGDDDYFKKAMFCSSRWLDDDQNMSCQRSTRFELPLDIRQLEAMNPVQYLSKHCIVSSRKRYFCAKAFAKLDSNMDSYLTRDEVLLALIEAQHHCITKDQASSVLETAQLSAEMQVDLQLFSSLACLTDRMFPLPFMSAAQKEVIEMADFEAIEWKLRGCSISPALRTLFTQL